MKAFILRSADETTKYAIVDPTIFTESLFEDYVREALTYAYEDYFCIRFRGAFTSGGAVRVADLALVHKGFTHWFIIEVELITHSLFNHVIPQVKCFEEGAALDSCVASLLSQLPNLSKSRAMTLVHLVPRSVAVVANRYDTTWITALRSINVQFVAVSIFQSSDGSYALETDGSLNVPSRSLGFYTYSALNRTLRLTYPCELPPGEIELEDTFGTLAWWTVRYTPDAVWLSKNIGDPGLADGCTVQVLITQTGKVKLRAF